ncbi:hypothetical protein ACFQGT_07130 [Natrialbaceae archaeon GCM10025810]|uniref:hypothetical protein n=1 Tax=Halovalidus salilacus TaxID=3075124 RepID=UPI00361EFC5F
MYDMNGTDAQSAGDSGPSGRSTARSRVTRRALLAASGSALAVGATGTAGARSGVDARPELPVDLESDDSDCQDATLEPTMGHCEGASTEGCSDEHPVTRGLRNAVTEVLEAEYPTVGALLEDGFVPYFDKLDFGEDGWSHWLNPEYIEGETILDPERPGSVLVDNETWRTIGVMFVAVKSGKQVDPPTLYEVGGADGESDAAAEDGDGETVAERNGVIGAEDDRGDHDHRDDHGERAGHDDHGGHGSEGDHHSSGDPGVCSPWHYHAGLPGRLAWWTHRAVHAEDADPSLEPPCRTPCMLHVWTVPHPEGTHAHHAPPREYRDDEPADAGFDTDATPGEDVLGSDAVPEAVLPAELELPGELSFPW